MALLHIQILNQSGAEPHISEYRCEARNTYIMPTSPKSCGDKRRVRIIVITSDADCPTTCARVVHAIPVRIFLSKSCNFSPNGTFCQFERRLHFESVAKPLAGFSQCSIKKIDSATADVLLVI